MTLTPCRSNGRDLAVGGRRGTPVDAEHERDIGTGDVGVEEADRRPGPGERDGKVDRDRALADAALARRHGDDVLYAGDELLRTGRRRAADHRRPGDVDRVGPDRADGRLGVRLDLVLEGTGRRGQLDGEGDLAAVDDDILDHVEGDDVAAELGLLHGAKHLADGAFGQFDHRPGTSAGLVFRRVGAGYRTAASRGPRPVARRGDRPTARGSPEPAAADHRDPCTAPRNSHGMARFDAKLAPNRH